MERLFDVLTVVYKYKKLYEKNCQALMKKYDLKVADIDILYYVSRSGHRDLARDIVDEGMSKANVSKAVEHLHSKGYVTLQEDGEDRRCIHIKPTESAVPIILEIEVIRSGMAKTLSKGIAPEDREIVTRVMRQLCENISGELTEL